MTPRNLLLTTALTFGIWEAVEIFVIDVPAAAAVFAALFLGGAAWFWRRDSTRAAACLLGLFAIEAAVAPTLKNTATATKAAAFCLGIAGLASAVAVLASRHRSRTARSTAAAHGA